MLRAAARFAARRVTSAGSSGIAPVAIGVRNVGLKTLAPTIPVSSMPTKPTMAAPAESAAAPVEAGKVSQIIGAVVDVQFGKCKSNFKSRISGII